MSFCIPEPLVFVPLTTCRRITKEKKTLSITFLFKNGHELRARYRSVDAWRSAGEQLDELLHMLKSSHAPDSGAPCSLLEGSLPLVVSLLPSL